MKALKYVVAYDLSHQDKIEIEPNLNIHSKTFVLNNVVIPIMKLQNWRNSLIEIAQEQSIDYSSKQ